MNSVDMKICTYCKVPKPVGEFALRSDRPNGMVSKCKNCMAKLVSAWRNEDPVRNKTSKRNQVLKRYGLDENSYKAMGDRCWICDAIEPGAGRKNFCIDHDHICCPGRRTCGNCNRGLLCVRCNMLIGMSGDNINVLRKAADYLEKRKAEEGKI